MLYKNLTINWNGVTDFIREWSLQEYTVDEFTTMIEKSARWHNVPIGILKQVVSMECGYPARSFPGRTTDGNSNPYRVAFSSSSNKSYMGPFQMHPGKGFWGQVVEDISSKKYKVKMPRNYHDASLGQLLVAMICNQAFRSTSRIMNRGELPLDARSFYFVHMWSPFTAGPELTKSLRNGTSVPARFFAGQSGAAKDFFVSYKVGGSLDA